MIINPDNTNLHQEVEQFLSDSGIRIENIPVTIIVDPPIRTVIENVETLSTILTELLTAYRTGGNYFLKLSKFCKGIGVAFGIKHTATSYTTKIGHC